MDNWEAAAWDFDFVFIHAIFNSYMKISKKECSLRGITASKIWQDSYIPVAVKYIQIYYLPIILITVNSIAEG